MLLGEELPDHSRRAMQQQSNQYASARSNASQVDAAVEELTSALTSSGAPAERPTLAVLFASSEYTNSLEALSGELSTRIGENLIGCTGEAIVHDAQEIEDGPCLSLWAAWMPGSEVDFVHLNYERAPDGGAFVGWPDWMLNAWPDDVTLLTLAEPYSFPADVFLERINADRPGAIVIGGMASGGTGPGEAKLFYRGKVLDGGAVVGVVRGAPLTPVVSQGCRPIGDPFVITKAERNEILELGGKRAHRQLKAIYDRLPNRDRELMRLGIHIGRVVDEYKDSFDYGDFLIRHVTGMNAEDESILVGDYFRAGQTVQFHVRDGSTASIDLQNLLRANEEPAQAALLFTCNGRGTRLFEDPHHDSGMIEQQFGTIPTAGFFCQGEMGPVGGQNFLHGFTASICLFH